MMSDDNGREACKTVRTNPDLQITKIIAMSGHLNENDGAALLHQGFDGFLKKLFTMHGVIQAIEDAVAVVY
jgi:CheY-like chemotaxis protein